MNFAVFNIGVISLMVSTMACATPPQVLLVKQLYQQYSSGSNRNITDLSLNGLSRYFDPRLAALVNKDTQCAIREQQICNLDFDLVWASQDPTGAKAQVAQGTTPNTVVVSINGDNDPRQLIYQMKNTAQGWRIANIRYQQGDTLVGLLSRP